MCHMSMLRPSLLRKFLVVVVLLSLALCQAAPVLAQSDDGVVPDDGTPAIQTGEPVEKGEFTPGESSSIDAGGRNLFLPLIAGTDTVEAAAVTPAATWQVVFLDHMCSYPNGWLRNDYNGTGQSWVYAFVDGYCTATPNATGHKINVTTTRVFSLAGATAARATFRFKMNTETYWDYLRVEYSCNAGKTYWGMPSQYSGAYGWSTATIAMNNCAGYSSVRIRFTFQTDRNVLSTLPPVLDYVKVEKYQ